MTDIFLSYQRKDEARVAPIVEGLRSAGLSVWWEHDLPVGQARRQSISEQLEAARGVIIPVRIDRVTEPLGFGEIQSLDLVGWRGNRRTRRFRNLVAAAKAVVAGGPRPRPMTPGRLAAWVGGLGVAAVAILGFASDLAGLQTPLCKIPGVHAACASWGLGGVPTEAEEVLWTHRVAGDCEGLRTYLARFPKGAFAEEAARRLQAAVAVEDESWTPDEQRLPLTVRSTLEPLASERAARADALARGATEADGTCGGFKSGEFRLLSASFEAQGWRCSARGSGFVCGFDGQAICQVKVRRVSQRQVCK